jgi:hypothetical protein
VITSPGRYEDEALGLHESVYVLYVQVMIPRIIPSLEGCGGDPGPTRAGATAAQSRAVKVLVSKTSGVEGHMEMEQHSEDGCAQRESEPSVRPESEELFRLTAKTSEEPSCAPTSVPKTRLRARSRPPKDLREHRQWTTDRHETTDPEIRR